MTAHWRAPAGLHVASARLPDEGELPSFEGATGWLNSPPLTPAGLRGKVILASFWTYTCVNWLRQLPYLRAWAGKYCRPRAGGDRRPHAGSTVEGTRPVSADAHGVEAAADWAHLRSPAHPPARPHHRAHLRDHIPRSRGPGLLLHLWLDQGGPAIPRTPFSRCRIPAKTPKRACPERSGHVKNGHLAITDCRPAGGQPRVVSDLIRGKGRAGSGRFTSCVAGWRTPGNRCGPPS